MNPLLRIIDANANRAREALRVMEDVARFGLDDAALCERLKHLRHALRTALDQPPLDPLLLLASRDVAGDEGRDVKTAAERTRAGLRDLAAAAAARLTEALRSIEEAAKAVGADASPIESLRYRAYEAGQVLLMALPSGLCPQWRLCVLLTESLCRGPWEDVAAAAIRGGADCLQLREKTLEDSELLARARALVAIARDSDPPVSVVVNDRPDIALLTGADGVHLGQADLPVAEVRALAGSGLLVGVSTSHPAEARAAVRSGADYCGVGPMFATTTKHKPSLSGPDYLRAYLGEPVLTACPHLAIGGITPANVALLRNAGCRGVAVSSAVCSAENPEAACRALLAGLGEPAPA
jgi:thiamine-phosphate pyrophosphorylase